MQYLYFDMHVGSKKHPLPSMNRFVKGKCSLCGKGKVVKVSLVNDGPKKVQGRGPPLSSDQELYGDLLGFDEGVWNKFLDVYLKESKAKNEPIVLLREKPQKGGNVAWFIETYETIGERGRKNWLPIEKQRAKVTISMHIYF